MSISFGGLASGLDTNTMIDQLMAVEAQPQTRLLRQQKVIQARQDLMVDIVERSPVLLPVSRTCRRR